MALAGPSRLSVGTLPIPCPGPSTSTPHHHDDAINPASEGTGKGKCKDLEEITQMLLDFDQASWGLCSLLDVESNVEETDLRIEEGEGVEKVAEVAAVAEEPEIRADGLARIENVLERVFGRIPPALAPVTAPRKTQTLGGRFTSAIRRIWSKSKSPTLHPVHDCIICQESIEDQEIRVPCGHYYDKECIISLFQASTKDESLYPPRCCRQSIPIVRVRKHFSPALTKEFVEKSREFRTLRRVYCADPSCSRFLGEQLKGIAWRAPGRKVYTCKCGMATCCRCKNAYRDGMKHTCSNNTDDGMEVVLALGKDNGWARCPGCRTMIELNMGCYHMTCLCKAEFCYLCQAPWKTCACSQWDETRLVAVAEERIDHELELDEVDVPPLPRVFQRFEREQVLNAVPILRRPIRIRPNREELIQAAVEVLRENHDCEHVVWRYRDGGGRCVGCYDVLDRYVYHCIGCHTIACNRCRHNRF